MKLLLSFSSPTVILLAMDDGETIVATVTCVRYKGPTLILELAANTNVRPHRCIQLVSSGVKTDSCRKGESVLVLTSTVDHIEVVGMVIGS
jgi:hypothetical protein